MNNMTKIVDLTHVITPSIPTWDGSCGFTLKTIHDYSDCTTATKFSVQEFTLKAGIGTHIDAPLHCFKDKQDVASMSLHTLIAPIAVLDVSHKVDASYAISFKDIQEFEAKYGVIQTNTFLLGYTGWGKKWHNPKEYRNEIDGTMYFPHFSIEAVQFLLDRNIYGIGIDTLSPDSASGSFPVHNLLLSHNKYIVENVAYVENLSATGMNVIIAPLAICGATESPVRMFIV